MTDLNEVQPIRDDFPDVFLRIDAPAGLVDVAQLDGLTDLDHATVGLLKPDDGFEQCGLADPVGADDAHDAVARQRE